MFSFMTCTDHWKHGGLRDRTDPPNAVLWAAKPTVSYITD